MPYPWYSTGTISVVSGQTVVTGTGTAFITANVSQGDLLLVEPSFAVIASAETQTGLTLRAPWTGSTLTDAACSILLVSALPAGAAKAVADLAVAWRVTVSELAAWAAGAATGGPNDDGRYPMTDPDGTVHLIPCPAKLATLGGGSGTTTVQASQVILGDGSTLESLLASSKLNGAKIAAGTVPLAALDASLQNAVGAAVVAPADNLLFNADFTSGPAGWNAGALSPSDGTLSVALSTVAGDTLISGTVNPTAAFCGSNALAAAMTLSGGVAPSTSSATLSYDHNAGGYGSSRIPLAPGASYEAFFGVFSRDATRSGTGFTAVLTVKTYNRSGTLQRTLTTSATVASSVSSGSVTNPEAWPRLTLTAATEEVSAAFSIVINGTLTIAKPCFNPCAAGATTARPWAPGPAMPGVATATKAGLVKIGANITAAADGTISVAAPYVHPTGQGSLHLPAISAAATYARFQVVEAGALTGTYRQIAWGDLASVPSTFTPADHTHGQADVTGLQATLSALAPLSSPTFTGIPSAPTATTGTASAQIATCQFVQAAVTNAVAALDPADPTELQTILASKQDAVSGDQNTIFGRTASGTGGYSSIQVPMVSLIQAADESAVRGLLSITDGVALGSVVPSAAGAAAVGTATTAARADHVHPAQTTVSGNAGTATRLETPRNISLTGPVTGSGPFDGSAAVSIATTLGEKGTWTPVLLASGENPSVAYAARHGVYVKIDHLVFVFGYVEVSAISGGAGYVYVGGLPFAAGQETFPASAAGSVFGNGFASGMVPKICSAYSTNATVFSYNTAGDLITIDSASVRSGSYFTISIQYIAAS